MLPPAVGVSVLGIAGGLVGAACASSALEVAEADAAAYAAPGSAMGTPQTMGAQGRVMGIPVRVPSGPMLRQAFVSAAPGEVVTAETHGSFWGGLKRWSGRSDGAQSGSGLRAGASGPRREDSGRSSRSSGSNGSSGGMTPLQRERVRQQQRREESEVQVQVALSSTNVRHRAPAAAASTDSPCSRPWTPSCLSPPSTRT